MKAFLVTLVLFIPYYLGYSLKSIIQPYMSPSIMKKVTEIRDVFFQTQRSEEISGWYHSQVGFDANWCVVTYE